MTSRLAWEDNYYYIKGIYDICYHSITTYALYINYQHHQVVIAADLPITLLSHCYHCVILKLAT